MKIIVCIKQVGYIYHPAAVDLTTGELDLEKIVFMLNPYDEVAVEAAVKVKEIFSDCEVVFITVGPPESEEVLKYAYAMGGDMMIRIDQEGFDPWSTAHVLAKAIEKVGYDILFFGKRAIDNEYNQVGAFVSELLKIPMVSGVVDMKFPRQDKAVVVQRYLGKGDRDEIECPLPALLTVEMGLNDPRYPTLPRRLLAEKTKVQVIDAFSLNSGVGQEEELTKVLSMSQPRPKPRKVFLPDSNLSAVEKVNLMMSGGLSQKKDDNLIEGPEDQLADKIIEFLIRNGVMNESEEK